MLSNRPHIAAAAALGAAAIALAIAVAPSQATYPGKNGRIAFRRYFDNDHRLSAIFTINVDGSGEQRVTHAPKGLFDDQPDWSPDGSQLVFSRCVPDDGLCAVYAVHADGSHLKRLSPPCPGRTGPPKCEDDSKVSFLPDGKHVVFTRGSGKPDRTQMTQHSDLVVSDLKGESRRVVLGSKPYQAEYNYAAYSPDGRQLVYEHFNSLRPKPRLRRALFVATSNGKGDHRITPWALDAGDSPDWSPDGKWIVFRSNVELENKQSQIYLIHPDGSGLKQLTHFKSGAIVTSSSFSPDNKSIVFATTGVDGNADLFVMRLDGSRMHPITRTRLWDSAPDWGPAG